VNLAAADLEDLAGLQVRRAAARGITSTPGTPWILMLLTPPRCWNMGKLNTKPFCSSTTVSLRGHRRVMKLSTWLSICAVQLSVPITAIS
jgi:hypothetical protein